MPEKPVGVINETSQPVPDVPWVRIKESVEEVLGRTIKPLSIVFVSKEKIRELNSRYRKKDKPTNVLSFKEPREIIFSVEVIKEEATQQDLLEKEWLVRLVVHGILHLEGYTHDNDEDANKMEALEEQILKTI